MKNTTPQAYKPLFFWVGKKYVAVDYITFVQEHNTGVDIEYCNGRETRTLLGEEAREFMILFKEHSRVVAVDKRAL